MKREIRAEIVLQLSFNYFCTFRSFDRSVLSNNKSMIMLLNLYLFHLIVIIGIGMWIINIINCIVEFFRFNFAATGGYGNHGFPGHCRCLYCATMFVGGNRQNGRSREWHRKRRSNRTRRKYRKWQYWLDYARNLIEMSTLIG